MTETFGTTGDASATPTSDTTVSSGPTSPSGSGPTGTSPSATPTTFTPDTRPKTLDAAFELVGLTGSPTPATTETPASATPAPAITEPDAVPPDPAALAATTEPTGPIPLERHRAILDNARRKTTEETVAKVEAAFGGAIQFQQRMQQDPTGALTQIIDEALGDPTLGPAVLSHVARALSSRRGKGGVAPTAEPPQPDLRTADGELLYSASQQAAREQWLRDQVMQDVEARTAPLQQAERARQQARQQEQHAAETKTLVTSRLGQWRKQPGFAQHENDIAVKQASYVEQGHDTWSALGFAYADVYHEKVAPKVKADLQSTLVRTAVAKSQSHAGNPASVVPATHKRPASWDEAFAQVGLK